MCEITRICARLPRRNARRQDRHHQSVAIADVPHIELAMPLVHHPVHAASPVYTTKPSGLGIGLSICRSIIEAHGGRLWAISNVPQGAVFQIHGAGASNHYTLTLRPCRTPQKITKESAARESWRTRLGDSPYHTAFSAAGARQS
jgi:hypothetical protein